MRTLLAMCLLLLGAFDAPAAPAPVPKGTAKKPPALLGAWLLTQERGSDLVITFTASGRTLWRDKGGTKAEEGKYELRDGKGPSGLDIWPPARVVNNKPPMLCIYHVEGDTLTIYFSDTIRPAKFEAGQKPYVGKWIMKRQPGK